MIRNKKTTRALILFALLLAAAVFAVLALLPPRPRDATPLWLALLGGVALGLVAATSLRPSTRALEVAGASLWGNDRVTDVTDWLAEFSSNWWFLLVIFVVAVLDSVFT